MVRGRMFRGRALSGPIFAFTFFLSFLSLAQISAHASVTTPCSTVPATAGSGTPTPGVARSAPPESEKEAVRVAIEDSKASRSPSDSTLHGEWIEVPLDRWLLLGPSATRLPIFSDTTQTAKRAEVILDGEYLDLEKLLPGEGETLSWQPGLVLRWTGTQLKDSVLAFVRSSQDTSLVSVAYAACYMESPRWQKVELVLRTRQRTAVYLDGKLMTKKSSATAQASAPEEFSSELILPRDKHLLLVKTVFDSRDSLSTWSIRPFFKIKKIKSEELSYIPVLSLNPIHRFSQKDIERVQSLRDITISPDGRWLAMVVSEADLKRDKYAPHLEIFDTHSGERVHAVRMGDGISEPQWSPDARSILFISGSVESGSDEAGSDLWLLDMRTHGIEKILSNEEGLEAPAWSHDGQYIFFKKWESKSKSEKAPAYEKLEELYERWDYWKNKSHIFVVSLSSKAKLQLTTGEFTVGAYKVSPDGKAIAFLRSVPIKERPFFKSELWRVDVGTLKSDTLLSEPFEISDFAWSPDGNSIAIIGESSIATPENTHNRYQQSLYSLDVRSRAFRKLTGDFGPTIGVDMIGGQPGRKSVWWDRAGRLFFAATDKSFVRVYYMNPENPEKLGEVKLPKIVSSSFDASPDGKFVACIGSSALETRKAYFVDVSRKGGLEVFDPSKDVMKYTTLASVERADFVDNDGIAIDGWLYYPQDFDSKQSYALIVYYYGGTIPMSEGFNRDAQWLAGQGYAVYVLTPRGAVGYGQAFADAHVNDWGGLSAKDVIEGTTRLLAAKSFLDKGRVGCYGGSYGGFLTMSLLTQTNIFKAAVAWYGISNITSYWGAGWWGYLYSDVASALSYPWNRPDVYVEKSPIFKADKINAALLLMHGKEDTNVPPVESEQMFTALKVLNKDVVYVRWEGEGHGISSKPSSSREGDLMMVEWFDKYLKSQPEAWEARWKKG
jgi:dipeptidyl aminopeptidase/acylaminoacyl peptidase